MEKKEDIKNEIEEIRKQRVKRIYEESKWFMIMTNKGLEANINKKNKKDMIKAIIETIKHLYNLGILDNYDIWLIEYEIDEWIRKWQ